MTGTKLAKTIFSHFSVIEDPRAPNSVHSFDNILFCVVVGVLCGADGFVQLERILHLKKDFLAEHLNLRAGIPSHDTIGRVFQLLKPEQFTIAFYEFISAITEKPMQELIHIDGKTLRGVPNKKDRQLGIEEDSVHMVSAFSSTRNVVLAQLKCKKKKNEIATARDLLEYLEVQGCVFTFDALHCQKKTVESIVEKGGDIVVCAKKNQPSLHATLENLFDDLGGRSKVITTQDEGHGRIEHRKYEVLPAPLGEPTLMGEWPWVNSIVRVQRYREVKGVSSSNTISYYISTLPLKSSSVTASAIRSHWSVENSLHHVLDVQMSEDHCRVRTKNAAENLSRVRQLCLSLMHLNKREKGGMRTKRMVALADNSYLSEILQLSKKSRA